MLNSSLNVDIILYPKKNHQSFIFIIITQQYNIITGKRPAVPVEAVFQPAFDGVEVHGVLYSDSVAGKGIQVHWGEERLRYRVAHHLNMRMGGYIETTTL